jgi:uncharacterized protein with ATP-grasp and redox domains
MTKIYPPSINGTKPGSWAHFSIKDRLPVIAQRVIEENQYPPQINANLKQLKEDIPNKPIRQLIDQGAPDQTLWQKYIQPYLGKDWLVVPWFFVETYFYRRIMEAVDYFNLGQDPFEYQKQQGLEKTGGDITFLAGFLADRLENPGKVEKVLQEGLYFSLWGNQADLSLWPAGSATDPRNDSRKSLQEHLLANDIKQVLRIFSKAEQPISQVDMMLDNAGFELVSDLALADILISQLSVERVILHVKIHPTFVSDVIEADLGKTIQSLTGSQDDLTVQFGKRLETAFKQNRIQTKAHYFWNSPLPMWDVPVDIREDLKESSLLISKGDANYRRILGDREWDFTEAFHRAVDYLPVPLVALRTLKAELAVGLDLDQIQLIFNQDPKWMTDGKWGVIHFSPGRKMRE